MKYLCVLAVILLTSTAVTAVIREIAQDCFVDCTARYAPVCGSDGNSYNNECELEGFAGCRNTPDLVKVKDGPCDVGTVVTLDSFEWDVKVPKAKLDAKSAITLNVFAELAKGSDSVSGKNLWKVGIFGSEWEDGYGDKYGYVNQILTTKQASKRAEKGNMLKLKNLQARFDISQIGCGAVAFFCVELARDRDSPVNFELRAGIVFGSIVACRRRECLLPNITMETESDLPPTCFESCPPPEILGGVVCGNNSVQYDSFCELTKAARCQRVAVKFETLGECPPVSDKVHLSFQQVRWDVMILERFRLNEPIGIRLNISVDVQENSEEIIGGTNLWRIAIYGSRDYYGDHENEKIGFIPQILDESDALHSPDIIPGRTLVFPLITTQFDLSAIGCGDYRYLCVTIAKSADSVPNFEISNNENKRKVVTCRIIRCINREPLPPPPTAWLRCLKWNVTNERVLEGKGYEVALKVNIEPFNDTDTINGTDLWRIGLFLSNATSGVMTRAQYQPDVLSEEDKAIPLIRGQNLLFTGLHGVLDVDGLGCPGVSLQYACLEFAKGESPSPYFYLPLGPSRAIIACKTINCHPKSQATDD